MSDTRWILTEHVGVDAFTALRDDWRRLCAEMSSPAAWHTHEAYTVYLEYLCSSPERFRCFALSDGERIRAILPLEERTERSLTHGRAGVVPRVWGMPWCDGWWVTDAIGPEDDARSALLPAVLDRLRRQTDRPAALVLGRTPAASVLWDGLATVPRWSRFAFDDGGECVIPADMSSAEFMGRLSRNSRQALRSSARKFEALDNASYVRAVAGEDLVTEYEMFLEVEASGWKGAHGSAVRQQPELEAFLRGLLAGLSFEGHCEIHSLHAEGRCIASAFCVYTRAECAVFKIGYDESYARISPGRLCNHKIIESCCEDPDITTMSEVGSAPWVRHWFPKTNGVRRAYVALRPVSGGFLLAALRIRYGPVRSATRAYKSWRRDHDDRPHGIRREAE